MPDPVETPAPSTVTPVVAPAAVVAPAPAVAAPADPAKPLEAAPADPAKPAEPAKPAVVVPEKYDFTAVKMPDGYALNAELIDVVSPLFKKHNLSQEDASELVQTYTDAQAKAETAGEAKRAEDFKEWMKTTVTNYQTTLRKEWGTEADAKLAIAQAGMAKIVTPAMKAVLDDTGLGSHPEFVKAFYQVGMLTREDVPPASVQPNSGGKNAAQSLYGTTPSNH